MEIEFNLPPALIIGLLISTVLPLLVGLVTTRVTHSGWKAVVLAALALVTAILTELAAAVNAGVAFDLGTALLLAIPTFLIAVGMHFGIWKPVGASAAAQDVLVTPRDTPDSGAHVSGTR